MRAALAAVVVLACAACAASAGSNGTHAPAGLAPGLLGAFEAAGVPAEPLRLALRALDCGRGAGALDTTTLTLVDYSLPSTQPRLWVLDLASGAVRFHTLVSHGKASGFDHASSFSNRPGSKQSSLGLFRTGETYRGRHGYSLRLIGLEAGINDLAYERGIVIHGAEYASPDFAAIHGRLGRSWGCPALDPAVHRQVIDTIRGGTALFSYYPDASWLDDSPFLHCQRPSLDFARSPGAE
jgi:hypothetical protein